MSNPQSPRTVCARALSRWLVSGDFPDRLIPEQTTQRHLVQEMLFGSVRWKRLLEWVLQSMVPRDPDPQTKAYLMTGLYQLFCMDNIPAHAALNETVEAAKADLDTSRIRFINGVLRNSLRQRDHIQDALSKAPVGIRLSHPDTLIARWTSFYGAAAMEALCNWNNQRPAVSIRLFADARHPENETLRRMLAAHPVVPDCFLQVPPGTVVTDLPGYATGAFYVQDPATHLAITLLELEPGLKLLDACAAPGGKALACADRMQDQGVILAADLHEDRLKRLRENVQRSGAGCIRIVQADATQHPGDGEILKDAPFDRILLDVPCSNTGVLNRRPDARWRFSGDRLAAMVALKHRMLEAAASLLAPGGILVYSTCSLEPEENMQQIRDWLITHADFKTGRQRFSLPPDAGTDGAFAAQLIRDR